MFQKWLLLKQEKCLSQALSQESSLAQAFFLLKHIFCSSSFSAWLKPQMHGEMNVNVRAFLEIKDFHEPKTHNFKMKKLWNIARIHLMPFRINQNISGMYHYASVLSECFLIFSNMSEIISIFLSTILILSWFCHDLLDLICVNWILILILITFIQLKIILPPILSILFCKIFVTLICSGWLFVYSMSSGFSQESCTIYPDNTHLC